MATTTRSRVSKPARRRWPDFVGKWPRLTGEQLPAFESSFEGDESFGDRAARLGAICTDERGVKQRCMPWQWWDLRKILSRAEPDDDGDALWTHPDVLLIDPRQQGKTQILVLRILFGLFKLDEQIVYSAQRWVTAEDVFDRVAKIIDSTPFLKSRLAKDPTKSGGRGLIELKSGAKVAFGVRSGDLGRGLTKVALVIFDEAYNLTEDEVAALVGSQIATGFMAHDAQTIYASTPPLKDRHPNCHVLAGLRRNGYRRTANLYFREHRAPDPADDAERAHMRDDPEIWRIANPSFGVIQNERNMRRLRDKATTRSALALFDADYLGLGDYPPDELGHDPIVDPEVWADMANEAPALIGKRVIGVERSRSERRRWAVAAGQRTVDGKIHCEVGFLRTASIEQVALYVATLVETWDPAAILVDARSQAAALVAKMKDFGIEVHERNTPQMARACSGILDAAECGALSHTGQRILTDAVMMATTKVLPQGDFVFDMSEGDIEALVAVTLAHDGVQQFVPEFAQSAGPVVAVDLDNVGGDFDALAIAF